MRKEFYRAKLIEFFSQHALEQAKTEEGIKKLVEIMGIEDATKLYEDLGYCEVYKIVEGNKRELEEEIRELSGLLQVQACLYLLYKKNKEGKIKDIEVLKELVTKGLYSIWNEEQRKLYDEGYNVVILWIDCFFSYINHDAKDTNNSFSYLICHKLKNCEYEKEWEERNFLAKLLAKYLKIKNLNIFYDRDSLRIGDGFRDKILKCCKSCFTFLQLIEESSFYEPYEPKDEECKSDDEESNWCFLEFKTFNQCMIEDKGINRYYFLLTYDKEIVFPPEFEIPPQYRMWYDKINELNYVAILDGISISEFRRKVAELAKQISIAKKGILKKYIGNYIKDAV